MKPKLKEPYNIYLGGLSILTLLPIFAPLLFALGLTSISKSIYFIYEFFCHQFAVRSIYLADYQYGVCVRCMGIYIGLALTAFFIKKFKSNGLRWYWVLIFILPLIIDGGIQTISTFLNTGTGISYLSNNFTRFITGSLFGIGISLWISPIILNNGVKFPREKFNFKFILNRVIPLYVTTLVIYIGLIGLWNISSFTNKPSNFLDNIPKVESGNFFLRRKDAVCPASPPDFFAIDCFLNK